MEPRLCRGLGCIHEGLCELCGTLQTTISVDPTPPRTVVQNYIDRLTAERDGLRALLVDLLGPVTDEELRSTCSVCAASVTGNSHHRTHVDAVLASRRARVPS